MADAPKISKHLAKHVEQRRVELGYTPTTLAEATGLSLQAIKNVRRGEVRQYQERLTGPLTRALGWSRDSIDLLLAGKRPKVVDPNPRVSPLGGGGDRVELLGDLVDRAMANWTEQLAALVDRVEALERRQGGS